MRASAATLDAKADDIAGVLVPVRIRFVSDTWQGPAAERAWTALVAADGAAKRAADAVRRKADALRRQARVCDLDARSLEQAARQLAADQAAAATAAASAA